MKKKSKASRARSRAAKKGWVMRRARHAARSRAAKKGWVTRRKNEAKRRRQKKKPDYVEIKRDTEYEFSVRYLALKSAKEIIRHDKVRPLNLNISLVLKKGFKGRMNATLAREWVIRWLDGRSLPRFVKVRGIDWKHGKKINPRSLRSDPKKLKDLEAFKAYIFSSSRFSRIE